MKMRIDEAFEKGLLIGKTPAELGFEAGEVVKLSNFTHLFVNGKHAVNDGTCGVSSWDLDDFLRSKITGARLHFESDDIELSNDVDYVFVSPEVEVNV